MKKSFYYLGAKGVGTRCLEILDRFCRAGGHSIEGVFTNPRGEGIRGYASERGLPLYEELEELEGLPPADFLVSVQYHRILRRHHIEKASILAINLHMAPLPEYRGCNQFSFAIVNGDGEFGTTIHELTEGVDAGGIISERRFPIPEGCYVEELFRITQDHSIALFEENLPLITAGEYKVVPQSEHLDSRKTSFHFRKDIEKLRRIDLDWPADRIVRHVRATAMPGFPPPYTIVDGVRIEFRIRDSDPAQGA